MTNRLEFTAKKTSELKQEAIAGLPKADFKKLSAVEQLKALLREKGVMNAEGEFDTKRIIDDFEAGKTAELDQAEAANQK